MRLITRSELATRTDVELAVLFGVAAKALGWTKRGTPERQRVMANLQNIGRARVQRHVRRLRVPGF